MTTADPLRCRLHFVATHGDDSREARELRRACHRGVLHRVVRGVYVASSIWSALDGEARHVLTTRAALAGLAPGCAASHGSALVVHGLPRVRRETSTIVTVTDPRRVTKKRSASIERRVGELPESHVVDLSGVRVTSLERTAVDVARTASFADAVLCLDAVLRRTVLQGRHRAGPDVDAALVRHRARLVDMVGPAERPGGRAARRAIAFASPWAENGGESLLRVALHELGVAPPVLQAEFRVQGRFAGRGDVLLDEDGVLIEFDGMEKFVNGAMLGGRSTAEALRRQKARNRRLLTVPEIRQVVHCDYLDIVDPSRLADLLHGAGVPTDPRRVAAARRAAQARFRPSARR
jgi:hypothetical protein